MRFGNVLRLHAMVLAGAIVFCVLGGQVAAQQNGRIVGRIVDSEGGKGLPAVNVQVVGTRFGTLSGVDGRFVLMGVPAGKVSLRISRIGFQPKTVTGLALAPGGALEQNVSLNMAVVEVAGLTVTATAEKGTVAAALDKQRRATGIVSAVTAEQISKSPDRDAAQAVQRVSGVTVQDNRYVFVRGLGERYTTTSLNGARLPSPEPERKVVPLDLFPAGLLQTITTSKTFTPDQPGDFSGASVDIQTREFPAKHVATFTSTVGLNSLAAGKTILTAPRAGPEWLAFAGSARNLPGPIALAGKLDRAFSPTEQSALAGSFRNVWSPTLRNGSPNGGFALSFGGEDPVFGHNLGYLLSGSYGITQDVRIGEVRATAVPNGEGHTRPFNEFTGSTGRSSVLWGGLLNLSTVFSGTNRISMNNMYNRTADNEAHQDFGHYETLNADLRRTTLSFIERSVRSTQLRGQHVLGARNNIDWTLSSSGVTRREPDRSDLVYIQTVGNLGEIMPLAWLSNSDDGAKRGFSDLTENELSGALNYKITGQGTGPQWELKFGGSYRGTNRNSNTRSYSIYGLGLTQAERELPPEQIFGGRFAGRNVFDVQNNSAGGTYTARDRVGAAYGMIEYPFGSRFRLITGARVESWRLDLETEPIFDQPGFARPRNTDVLPSAILNIKITEDQNVRMAVTRTLSRPEYRELSPITFRDVIGEQAVTGNPGLKRSLVDNVDLRWEAYRGSGEMVSVALFAKRFHDPIERVDIATSGASQLGFVNAEGASNYGVELEVRKGLEMFGSALANFAVFANTTLMRSEIRTGNDSISSLTNKKRPMVGQSPYVVNAGITYATTDGLGATLMYNVVGKRITSAGVIPLPDTYELPRHVLDFSAQLPINSRIGVKLAAKNLLDAAYERKQGDVTRLQYSTGRVFSAGFNWKM